MYNIINHLSLMKKLMAQDNRGGTFDTIYQNDAVAELVEKDLWLEKRLFVA